MGGSNFSFLWVIIIFYEWLRDHIVHLGGSGRLIYY